MAEEFPVCCGKKLKTPFCPHCGKTNELIHGAKTLLNYLNGQLSKAETWARRWEDRGDSRQSLSSRKTLRKWRIWIRWVEKAIEDRLGESLDDELKQRDADLQNFCINSSSETAREKSPPD